MTITTTTSTSTSTSTWNKHPYYHPKIHDVTEGLKSVQTARQYKWQFNVFLRYLRLHQQQLQQEQGREGEEDDLRFLLQKDPQEIEELIVEYLTYLNKEKHLKTDSIRIAKSAIVHFFKRNRVKLDKDWISECIPANEGYKQRRGYYHKEIQQLLGACSEDRIRVAILLMCSTGMRVGAIVYTSKEEYAFPLEYGDLEERPEYGGRFKVWVYNRSKTERYDTICSRECAFMIRKYLAYRKSSGEIIKEDSPLIREQFDADNEWAVTHPRKISLVDLNRIMKLVINKSGISKQTNGKVKQTHGFRAFYNTNMAQAGIPDSHRRILSGHAPVGQDRSYVTPPAEDLLADYLKAEDLLTINDEYRLQKKVEHLEGRQSEEMARLKSDMDEMKRLMETMDLVDLQNFPVPTSSETR